MDNYQPKYVKDQAKLQEQIAKNSQTLSYRIKGMAAGAGVMFFYTYLYQNESKPYMIVAGGMLGYFFGWIIGNFFYTKK
jgi:hypothetical protein